MDGAPMTTGSSSGSTSTGGPAPFLLKTYEMVDDSATDDIVSWSASRKSFVVWNPPEFARILLPTYFKHNNFSSFIRQLNTYGFRKIDPEKWEFSNEEFIKDKKHLLKNIHRRKPIHSHSNNPQISTVDPERANYEEEIEKLSREKSSLETQLTQLKQKSSMKLDLNELTHRVNSIETRQENLLTYLEKAVQNPNFVERLNQKLESMDFSAFNKKRRLPDNNQSGSHYNNLSLDLSSSGPREISLDLSDMDDSSFSCKTQTNDEEECDVNILCELNLSLASSPLQINKGSGPGPEPKPVPGPVQARVNDVFWEQFLTERPGSDTEEASSCLRERNYVDNEEGSVGPTNNQLTL